MKKRALSLLVAFGVLTFAASAWHQQDATSYAISHDSPQFCQYSLSKYTGTITNAGLTESFSVGLSCPSQSDTYATVVVLIDDIHIASKVITVPAGKTYSESTTISVGHSYVGKRYNLVVQ